MVEVIIFDMDGLLVDSEPCWHDARSNLFREIGLEWTQANDEHTMGVSTGEWADYMVSLSGGRFNRQQVINEVLARMEARYRRDIPFAPGAREIIDRLAPLYPMAIASGSHPRLLRAILDATGWEAVFDQIVSGDEVAHGKPAPDIYLETARRLDVPPAKCAVFEDAAFGIQAARAAGMHVIAVPNRHLPPPAEVLATAGVVLDSLEDFHLEQLKELT